MNGQSTTVCWKCKTKYSFMKDPSGSTNVTCPKCKSKAVIKSVPEQPRPMVQQPQQQMQPQMQTRPQMEPTEPTRRNTPKISSSIVVIALCIGLIISSGCAMIVQMNNSDMQSRLITLSANVTDAQNNVINALGELTYVSRNLTTAQSQVISLQNSLTMTQSDLATKTAQLLAMTNDFNLVSILLGNQSQFVNNTNKFIKTYYNATSVYYNGTALELLAYQKYNASEIHYNNYNWINAFDGFNDTKNFYNLSKQKYQLSADKFNETSSYTDDVLYKNLTMKFRDAMNSSVRQMMYLYNASEFMRLASMYSNTSVNDTEANQSINSSIAQRNLYATELGVYNSCINETKVILAQIENS
jgi:DNA-directed RNA polymerase subunit RPC12/RpoP